MPPNGDARPRRVVVTGLGVIAPNGNDVASFWESVRNGVSGAGIISQFDVSACPM